MTKAAVALATCSQRPSPNAPGLRYQGRAGAAALCPKTVQDLQSRKLGVPGRLLPDLLEDTREQFRSGVPMKQLEETQRYLDRQSVDIGD